MIIPRYEHLKLFPVIVELLFVTQRLDRLRLCVHAPLGSLQAEREQPYVVEGAQHFSTGIFFLGRVWGSVHLVLFFRFQPSDLSTFIGCEVIKR